MPITFPAPFPAHQGLILPVARRWPDRFDVIALSVGAAMPDLTDISLGFIVNGYFKQWIAHSLIGAVLLDIPGGLLLTWLAAILAARFFKKTAVSQNRWRTTFGLWNFSVIVGVISHLAFDLISHETNLLLYPWHDNLKWFPEWWYTPWLKIQLIPALGHSYSVGPHTIIWGVLSVVGTIMFYQFVFQKSKLPPPLAVAFGEHL